VLKKANKRDERLRRTAWAYLVYALETTFYLLFSGSGGRCDHDCIGGFAIGIDLDRISFRLEKAMSAWPGCER
jgi:hypothetical protein